MGVCAVLDQQESAAGTDLRQAIHVGHGACEVDGQYGLGARADRVIAKVRAAGGDVALFAHGHVLRVFVARWLGLPASAGQHFLLDTGTLNILSYYRSIPAVKTWNAQLSV